MEPSACQLASQMTFFEAKPFSSIKPNSPS
jgi:hypothetical protein